MLQTIFITLTVINLAALLAFGLDKLLARRGARRISERRLCLFALPLGAFGAWAGVFLFRHKTSKPSFLWKLAGVTVLQLAVLVAWWIWGRELFS